MKISIQRKKKETWIKDDCHSPEKFAHGISSSRLLPRGYPHPFEEIHKPSQFKEVRRQILHLNMPNTIDNKYSLFRIARHVGRTGDQNNL